MRRRSDPDTSFPPPCQSTACLSVNSAANRLSRTADFGCSTAGPCQTNFTAMRKVFHILIGSKFAGPTKVANCQSDILATHVLSESEQPSGGA